MNIAILGFGKEGQAALEYWGKADDGNHITVCDQNSSIVLPDNVTGKLGQAYLQGLDRFDLIVRSPHVHPRDIAANNSPDILAKVVTGTEEFIRKCPAPIIGVTGTKGKGTTSSLITAIIREAGYKVHLGGNIGIAPVAMFKNNIQPEDWVVLELSSFQLYDLKASPKVAVCLMVVPEHLDWHADMEEYIASKQNLFLHQTEEDLTVYNRGSRLSKTVADVSAGFKMSYEVPDLGQEPAERQGAYVSGQDIYMDEVRVCSVSDVALLGRHNLENVCAAITATWDLIGQKPGVIQKAVSSFKGLEHRLELVRQINGISYYDDSFGTTPETAIVALAALPQPKVLILGGSDKGLPFGELAQAVVKSNVRAVVQIGITGPAIANELGLLGFTNIIDGGQTMASILQAASSVAQPGDAVLLSTGCASFGLFKDYIDRGDQFKTAVNNL